MKRPAPLLVAGLCLALVPPSAGVAQSAGGVVTGTVLAAATGLPIANAVVVLEAAPEGAVVVPAAGGPFLGRTVTAVTDAGGTYRFANLPRGRYRLMARHLGYHEAVIEVDLARSEPFRVSVGLVVNPIRLEAMDVRTVTTEPYGRRRTLEDEIRVGRMSAEQYRDGRFLEGDATVLTHADVTEAVTLGETDLFRALQRLPGVSTRDDWTAALWTRGAPWSQTRVYFDGLPLFNPVHAIGVVSGLNPDAVGSASFHPGVRSAAVGEGAAGVLNVESRGASGPGMNGLGELSVVSARAALDLASAGGRTRLMLAARRSYVDLLTSLVGSLLDDTGSEVPYSFHDLVGRFDADLGRGATLEASAMWERDAVRGGVPDLLRDTRGHWGNRIARVTVGVPRGGLRVRGAVGASRFSGDLGPDGSGDVVTLPSHARTRNDVSVTQAGIEIAPDGATRPRWAAGLQVQAQRQSYAGQYPRPYPVVVIPESLLLDEALRIGAVWAERRVALGRHAAVDVGVRAEAHGVVANGPSWALAPRVSARVTPGGGRFTVSAGAGRSWQYTQALAPAGPSIGPDLYVTDVWLLANDTIPAVRADIATLGGELWLGRGWVASVNAYARRATGVAVPEPAPGSLIAGATRPIHVPATNTARGIEAGVRRLVGRWTLAASYALGRSDLTSASALNGAPYRYPASADRRHTFDATAMVRMGSAFRVGTAFSAASGAPFSRFILGGAPCDTVGCPTDTVAVRIENPGGARTAAWATLDLLVDWTRPSRTWRIGAFLQLRNVLNLTNAVTYTGSVEQCTTPRPPRLRRAYGDVCDRFNRGVGLLPLAGVRIAF